MLNSGRPGRRLLIGGATIAIVLTAIWFLDRNGWGFRTGGPVGRAGGAPVSILPAAGAEGGGGEAASGLRPPHLFSYVATPDAARLDAALRAPTERAYYVQLDQSLFTSKSSPFWQAPGNGTFRLPLPNGGAIDVVVDNSQSLGPNRFTSTGRIPGRPLSRAVFGFNEGFLNGSVEDPELGTFVLATATVELTQFYKVDPVRLLNCGGEILPRIDEDALETFRGRKQPAAAELTGAAGESAPAASSVGANVEVHLMMAYAQGVLATVPAAQRPAAVQSAFDAAVAAVNADLAASLVSVRIRLVRIAPVFYVDDDASDTTGFGVSGLQSNMLEALRRTTDSGPSAMNELHAIRDEVGADLICLIHNREDSSSAGLGYVLDDPAGIARADDLSPYNALYGFSVVQYNYINSQHVLSHELGHNLGCVHDRDNSNGAGAYSYSYGYRFTGLDGRIYRDIMAYQPGTRLGYFSNPDISPAPANAPIGVAPGLAGEADCALTIDKGGFEVAGYRLQTLASPNAGNLINVSTRAYVGTGDQVMIAGFVITGTQPKTMLIRAAGPAIAGAPFNVPAALIDPELQLVRTANGTSVNIASNDNWEDNGAAATVAAAASQVGAFGFPSGSRDATILATNLLPGAYTPLISGKGGTTGMALVEAYEVTRTDNRVVNLSTRAYGDLNREIIAGFVVQGGVGTTKRILIRTRGPSLAGAGITNPMDDPIMSLHNSTGDLVMVNDDWTTITLGNNDALPTQQYYNETQIFATGYAPGNRREPALLLDLAPGPYTAIVRPFQDLNDFPPQIASPGIAIVEVFELGQ